MHPRIRPLMKKGTVLTCVNFHKLLVANKDIEKKGVIKSADFDPIGEYPKPKKNDKIALCHECGFPVIFN